MKARLLIGICAAAFAAAPAIAADLPMKAPPAPPPVLFSWTGFYIGANIGGKWATFDHEVTGPATTVSFTGNTNSSWIAGGQVGYNWQTGAWVFGVEGDIDAQRFSRQRVVGTAIGVLIPGDTFTAESNWQASLRGRIGYAAWDRSLIYVTGGAAWTNLKGTVALVGLGTFTGDRTITGGTVGLGYEYAFSNNISLGIEGRWSFYGDRTFTAPVLGVSDKVSLDTAEVMAKLNFRFGGYGGY